MQNVTVTCKTSQFIAHNDSQCKGKLNSNKFRFTLLDLQEIILNCEKIYPKNRQQNKPGHLQIILTRDTIYSIIH